MKQLESGHYEFSIDDLEKICTQKCIEEPAQVLLFGTTLTQMKLFKQKKITTWYNLENLP